MNDHCQSKTVNIFFYFTLTMVILLYDQKLGILL